MGSKKEDNDIIKIDLFKKGDLGYDNFRIPAICIYGDNGKNSEGILVACEARTRVSDWSCKAIYARRSNDGGVTWSDPYPLIDGDIFSSILGDRDNKAGDFIDLCDDGICFNNPVLISETPTRIHFLFCVGYRKVFHAISNDGGESFSDFKDITEIFDVFREKHGINWNVVAVGPGKGIRKRKDPYRGRLIVPVWMATGKGKTHHPNVNAVIYSDDGGINWVAGDPIYVNTPDFSRRIKEANESQVVELSNGRVMINMRTRSGKHRRAESISPDGAYNWSRIEFNDELFDPICMGSITALHLSASRPSQNSSSEPNHIGFSEKKDLSLLFFSNPSGIRSPILRKLKPFRRIRANLCIRVSFDEGKSWPIMKIIERGPSGYSDIVITNPENLINGSAWNGDSDKQIGDKNKNDLDIVGKKNKNENIPKVISAIFKNTEKAPRIYCFYECGKHSSYDNLRFAKITPNSLFKSK